MLFALPNVLYGEDVKKIRKKYGFTQKEMAEFVNVSQKTIERWEMKNAKISGPAVSLLGIVEKYPHILKKIEIPPKAYPMRLWYMYDREICTVIDVDESRRQVKVYNFTDRYQFRAFGREENPDFSQYEAFLEERCFPKTRDKMKLILKEMDLPFYDPLLIIEKTEGRMAEDHFWIQIER